MKIALLCDVDQAVYHVGDEAIAHATKEHLESLGHEVIMISRHEKYGPGGAAPTASIPALTFPWGSEDRDRYLDEVRRLAAGDAGALPADDKAHGIIAQLRAVDALVIGGGGSLNSRYGWLLSERIATGLIAAELGKPVVLTGQSIGPALDAADRAPLAELLNACALVGVRDRDSYTLARSLAPEHPALFATMDDAHLWASLVPAALEDRITVTIAADPEPLPDTDHLAVLAALIDRVAEQTGAPVELVPHMADPDAGGSDEARHSALAALLAERYDRAVTLHRIEPVKDAVRRQLSVRYVLSTRFHPVVFATMSGAHVWPLAMDRYGASRMDGALANAGVENGVLPIAALWDPVSGGPNVAAIDRAAGAFITRTRGDLADRAAAWMDHVAAVLTGSADPAALPALCAAAGQSSTRPQRTGDTGETSPSVAIIMRTKDRALLLDRAIQDVLGQTHQDWQLMIVNDCGDPAPVHALVERWAHEAHGRIRVLDRTSSAGMESASNAGIEATASEFIAIHDDDDTWHPAFLQQTVTHLRAHPEHAAVSVRTEIVHERIVPSPTGGERVVDDWRHVVWPRMGALHLSEFLAVNRMVPISVLHRRTVHEDVGMFREDLPVVGDYAFHLELLKRHQLGFIQRPLAEWRLRPAASGAASNSMFAQKDAHRQWDRELTEPAIRSWLDREGLGEALYMSRMVEEQLERALEHVHRENCELREQLDHTNRQLDEVLGILKGRGPRAVVRRVGRRVLGR